MTDTARHKLLDGKVQLYCRPGSPHWQCSCTIAGRQRRSSTGEESLAAAKDVARDWYLGLMGKYRSGELKEGRTFREAAAKFIDEFVILTAGERSPIYVDNHKRRLENYLLPFFGGYLLSEITPGLVQDYRVHRMKTGRINAPKTRTLDDGTVEALPVKPPARGTMHQEIVCLRQVLDTAHRQGWLPVLPSLKAPYRASGKIDHRAWFSPEEYTILRTATAARAKKPIRERWRGECEDLHDFVLIMVNSGLRPDEAKRLRIRDVTVVDDVATRERILEIEVRQGKRGYGYCKTMKGAVHPYERLLERRVQKRRALAREAGDLNAELIELDQNELVFPSFQRQLFNAILNELGMKKDADGRSRTFYSLRHTYISMRLLEGADIYQIAKNCRTSVEMIEKFYAAHIKDRLDTAAINVRKPKAAPPQVRIGREAFRSNARSARAISTPPGRPTIE